jgi:ferredoxin
VNSSPADQLAERVRQRARELLATGQADLVIGHRPSWRPRWSGPSFVTAASDAVHLTAGPSCQTGLAKYLLEETEAADRRVALIGRGCDILGARRLIADRRVDPARVRLIWLPCAGRAEPDGRGGEQEGPMARACRTCDVRVPSTGSEYGEVELLLSEGDPLAAAVAAGQGSGRAPGANVSAPEGAAGAAGDGERHEAWAQWFRSCLRCYACRAACPACHCRVCVLEAREPRWVELSTDLPQQFMFHFVRAMDVAGRCVACGECERSCPAGIPLMELVWAQARDIGELFGVKRPHVPGSIEPLGRFEDADADPEPGRR